MTADWKKLKVLKKKRRAEPWCPLAGTREGRESEA